jgi:hypothetical protein
LNLGFKLEPRDEFKLFELLFYINLNAEILNWFKIKRKKKEEQEPVSRFLRFEIICKLKFYLMILKLNSSMNSNKFELCFLK